MVSAGSLQLLCALVSDEEMGSASLVYSHTFNPRDNPLRSGLLVPPLSDEFTVAQDGSGACPKAHSQGMGVRGSPEHLTSAQYGLQESCTFTQEGG